MSQCGCWIRKSSLHGSSLHVIYSFIIVSLYFLLLVVVLDANSCDVLCESHMFVFVCPREDLHKNPIIMPPHSHTTTGTLLIQIHSYLDPGLWEAFIEALTKGIIDVDLTGILTIRFFLVFFWFPFLFLHPLLTMFDLICVVCVCACASYLGLELMSSTVLLIFPTWRRIWCPNAALTLCCYRSCTCCCFNFFKFPLNFCKF